MTVEWHGDRFVAEVLNPSVHDGLTQAAIVLQRQMGRTLSQHASPSSPGSAPGVDTGGLSNSIVFTTPRGFRTYIGSPLPYAIQLDRGATIVAKGKKLTVPLNDKAKRLRRQNASLASVGNPKLSFVRTPNGAYLVRNVGGRAKRTEFWFKLVDRVTIAARPWLEPSLLAAKDEMLRRFVAGALDGIKRRGFAAVSA